MTVGVKERLEPYPSGPRLYYSVTFRGKAVFLDSPLGLDFAGIVTAVGARVTDLAVGTRVAGIAGHAGFEGGAVARRIATSAGPLTGIRAQSRRG